MKKNPFLFFTALLLVVFSSLYFSGSMARAEQDSLLKIQAIPDQNTVKGGMMFLVHVQATNTSDDTSTDFWSNTCSYEKHWVTDNPGVFIQSWTCNENVLEEITLGPGESYEKNIILYIPKSDATGSVTFRLGFKRMSEDGDVAEPLWSDPVTMNVVVPEEMKEAAPAAAAGDASQMSDDQAPGTSAEVNSTAPAAASDSAAPVESKPPVFKDPGVPVKVSPDAEFSIALVSNPSTGFGWKMTLPVDQKAVKFLGSGYVASQTALIGAPGEEVYKFKALTPGETKVDFVYVRPWERKTAPPRKIFTILVQKS